MKTRNEWGKKYAEGKKVKQNKGMGETREQRLQRNSPEIALGSNGWKCKMSSGYERLNMYRCWRKKNVIHAVEPLEYNTIVTDCLLNAVAQKPLERLQIILQFELSLQLDKTKLHV